MREAFAMSAAIAMIGTACCGPNAITRSGTRMTEDPVPTTPLYGAREQPGRAYEQEVHVAPLGRRTRRSEIDHCSFAVRSPRPSASSVTASVLRLTPSALARSDKRLCSVFGVRNTQRPE